MIATRRWWPPIDIAFALVLVVIAGWQIVLWDDVGVSTCGPLYRPDIWTVSDSCLQGSLPRLGVVLVTAAVAVGLLVVAIRALLAEEGAMTRQEEV